MTSPTTMIAIAMATALAQPLYFSTGRLPKRPSLLDVPSSMGIAVSYALRTGPSGLGAIPACTRFIFAAQMSQPKRFARTIKGRILGACPSINVSSGRVIAGF
jgi:hypothetical protein